MAVVLFPMVGVDNFSEFEAFEENLVLFGRGDWALLRRMLGQGNAEGLDFLNSHNGTAKKRQAAHQAGERAHEVQRANDVAGQGLGVELHQGRNQKQYQANEAKIEQMTPILGGDKADLGGDILLL